jgi:hypothetical protein
LCGFSSTFICSRKWLSQLVRFDLSLGHYDYVQRTFSIPNNEWISIGEVDFYKWKLMKRPPPWEKDRSKPRPLLTLTTFNPLEAMSEQGTPRIDDLILEQDIKVQ